MQLIPEDLAARSVFDRPTAHRHGVSDADLRKAVAAGVLTRVRRGWFALVRGSAPSEVLASYLDRCRVAAVTRGRPLTGISALAALGLPVWALDDRPVYLEGESTRRHARAGVVLVTPTTSVDDAVRSEVVDVVEALLTAALVDPEMALAAADAAVRAHRVSRDEVVAALPRIAGRRGSTAARETLLLVDGRRESAGESRTAYWCHRWGIPLRPQVRIVTDAGTFFGDFEIEGTGVVLEFDGALKYSTRDDLVREKRREDAIRRTGRGVERVVWSDFERPAQLRARLLAAIDAETRWVA